MNSTSLFTVMAGLDPAIRVFENGASNAVDDRVKPGHDGAIVPYSTKPC
jgi:hypothetical protein